MTHLRTCPSIFEMHEFPSFAFQHPHAYQRASYHPARPVCLVRRCSHRRARLKFAKQRNSSTSKHNDIANTENTKLRVWEQPPCPGLFGWGC